MEDEVIAKSAVGERQGNFSRRKMFANTRQTNSARTQSSSSSSFFSQKDAVEDEVISKSVVGERQGNLSRRKMFAKTRQPNSARTQSSSSSSLVLGSSSKSLFCSCDSAKARNDLFKLRHDTKIALEKAWKQAASLEQAITEKKAFIDELRWQIKFSNERKAQALHHLKCKEDEMDNALMRHEQAAVISRSRLKETPGRAMRKIFSCGTKIKALCRRNNRLYYADLKLMVSSRDITIDAMKEVIKEAEVSDSSVLVQNNSFMQI
jgi:hypothetical protein